MDYGINSLVSGFVSFVPKLPTVAVDFLVGYLIIYISVAIFGRTLKIAGVQKSLIDILKSLLSFIFWVVLIAHILRNLGLSQIAVTLSGSLLVVGLAVANGAGAMVSDIISGLFLARDKDFDLGYRVKVGDTEGFIETMDFRKTRIRTDDGRLVVLPNSMIDKDRWYVISRSEHHTLLSKVKNKFHTKKEVT
ncbi:MAG: mechanosensitive ion channel domain-containing protein [Patescibacteria group bacterium]|jgi:small-conductance mechanosensitive channel